MGLAGPRKRTKIGHDPNNTTWARDDTTYGSKILRAQGWTPGSYLGAKDAAHASHLTAASASHIRVALREDNLGLGAKRGADPTENFGLSGFQSLLGRLNGKSEVQLANEKRVASMLRLEQKYQQMGFVKAGYLLGDNFDKQEQEDADSGLRVEEQKRLATSDHNAAVVAPEEKRRKKKRKGEKQEVRSDGENIEEPNDEQTSRHENTPKSKGEESQEDRRRRKLEKREKKEARRKRKAASTTSPAKVGEQGNALGSSDVSSSSDQLERSGGGRHAIRQRFIRQKRMSGMDPKAMREILMIKS